ncbi:MAG: PEP-utilizing enzyme, partial [Burkholderiaceae bacterium]|nr:PEP-utilizing enzyme [Burkholderiaceae bacterium]
MTLALHGLQVSRGVTIGRAVVLASARLDVAHYFVEPGSEEREVDRLRSARSVVLDEMDAVKRDLPADTPAEVAALIDVHMMLLDDSTLRQDTARWIRERRYNAEWALTAQLDVLARQFDEMDDEYLRERKHDIEQVVERLLRALRAQARGSAAAQVDQEQFFRTGAFKLDPTPLVLVAHDIAPGDMLQFKRGLFGGFVTDTGGPTSHTAIVARSLDIPAVVGAREATRLIRQDDTLVIDADAGVVLVAPDERIRTHYERRQREIAGMRRKLTQLRDLAAVTLDGVAIDLHANIELPEDAYAALQAGADGVGLFRSEFLFMNRSELPGEDEQFEAYRAALRAMSGKPVTI